MPYRAGFPCHNSQPGSGRSPVVNTEVAEKDSCPQTHSRAPEQLVQFPRGKLFPTHRKPCPGPQPRLHLARRWATPCQDCAAEEEGAPGRSQELPAPAWARRHTGRNVPSSAGPPSACRLPHPGIAECNPRAGGGCSWQGQRAPLQLSAFALLLCTKGSRGNLGVRMQTWKSACTQPLKELTTPGLQGWHTMPRAALLLYPG